jgi:hypothetical protein
MGKSQKPLTQARLARMLKPLGITSKKIGPEDHRVAGYIRKDFDDAFGRYLPPEAPKGDSKADSRTDCDEIRTSEAFKADSHDPGCRSPKCGKSNNDGVLSGCPSRKRGNGQMHAVHAPEPAPDTMEPAPAVCTYCGRPGGREVAFGDDGAVTRLHRECEKPWIAKREIEEGHRPGRRRFQRVDGVPDGTPCVHCHTAEGEVFRMRDSHEVGGKSEPLHEDCAPKFFGA